MTGPIGGKAALADETAAWGSDLVAQALRATGMRYVALTPGSSFRGLHESLVNHLGDEAPTMLLCLHEEHAVAIAHGYAKASGEPMAAVVHANVGLMHAAMAVYNAYCDRAPLLLLGATGPVDAELRRPWIDWIHTSADQAALVRNYVKCDDQPASPAAAVKAVLRGNQVTRTQPSAPVYVCFDVTALESAVPASTDAVDASRHLPASSAEPARASLEAAVDLLRGAARPVVLVGRHHVDQGAFDRRVQLAESLGAVVVTDLRLPSAFPTTHPLHAGWPVAGASAVQQAAITGADVLLALDWVDLAGTLRTAFGGANPTCTIISSTIDHHLHNGWSKDHQDLAPVDVALACPPDVAVRLLLELVNRPTPAISPGLPPREPAGPGDGPEVGADGRVAVRYAISQLRAATGGRTVCLTRLPFAWDASWWPAAGPLDSLGRGDGGGGVGSGPGIAVGAALALRGTGRLAIAVLGDGDYLMGLTALWTAARYKIPLLVVVMNNASYFNDEVHQHTVSEHRGRSTRTRSVGIHLDEPDLDLAMLARGQGVHGFGPVVRPQDLRAALDDAVAVVEAGGQAVVDVRVERAYPSFTTAA